MHDADSILAPFLRSTDESERDRLLGELIDAHAAPIISSIIRRRLGKYLRRNRAGFQGVGAEDVHREVVAKLVQRLLALRSGENRNPINDFRRYVIGVTTNACNDYLRSRSPARSNLRDNLRDALASNPEFKTWKIAGNRTLGGLSAWEGVEPESRVTLHSEAGEEIVRQVRAGLSSGGGRRRVPLSDIVARIFTLSGQPIELDDLAEIVAELSNVRDLQPESLDRKETFSHHIARLKPVPTLGCWGRNSCGSFGRN
jgi:hypothetical protein